MKPGRITRIIAFFLHPAVLPLPLLIIIIFLLPDIFSKYKVTLIREQVLPKSVEREYHDLDDDELSEYLTTGNNKDKAFLNLVNQSGIIGRWDFQGNYAPVKMRCIVGDFDNDKVQEIYPLIVRHDSLFINSIDLRFPGEFMIRERFLITIQKSGVQSCYFISGKLTDLNGDGFHEVVFAVNNGYGLFPRRVIAYDVKNDTVLMSPELGANINELCFQDLDGDGQDEITVSNHGSATYPDTAGVMHDRSAWFIILNNTLDFYFKPEEYKGDFNYSTTLPVSTPQGDEHRKPPGDKGDADVAGLRG